VQKPVHISIADTIWVPGKEFVDNEVTGNNIKVSIDFDRVWDIVWNEANGAVQSAIFQTISDRGFKL